MPLFTGAGGGLLRKPTTGKLMRAPSGGCCCETCDCCVAFKDVTLAGGFVINDIGVQTTSGMSTNIHETAFCDQQSWTFTMTIINNTGGAWNGGLQGLTFVSYLLSDFEFVSASPTQTSKSDNGTTETIIWDYDYSASETRVYTVTFKKKNCGTGQEYDINGGVQQGKDAELTIEQVTCS